MEENKKFPSELRMDVVNKDWVLLLLAGRKSPEILPKKERKENLNQVENVRSAIFRLRKNRKLFTVMGKK